MSEMWAVLVGLNFYPNPANRLLGAVNDIDDIELTLRDHYGTVKITKLVAAVTGEQNQIQPPGHSSSWPTWDNIIRALEFVANNASADDVVYIHYSGHGTLRRTKGERDYREDYGLDAGLVLFEPGASRRVRYLRGIELALLLDILVKKGLNLTIVLDCCHSGSISRSDRSLVRGIPWNEEIALEFPARSPVADTPLPSSASYHRDATLKNQWLLSPHGYNLIAACGPHELAKEIKLRSDRFHGALSYHLLEALDYSSEMKVEPATYEAVFRRICAKMYTSFPTQHPVMIGNDAHLFLRAAPVIKRKVAGCEVVQVLSDSQVKLNIGQIQGASIGDVYAIQMNGIDTTLSQEVVLIDVSAASSIAERATVPGQHTHLAIRVGCRASIAALAKPRAYVNLPRQSGSGWNELVVESLWLEGVLSDEPTHLGVPYFSIAGSSDNKYEILDRDGNKYSNIPPIAQSEKGAELKVVMILEHLAKFLFVQALNNAQPQCLMESDYNIEAWAKDNPMNTMQKNFIEVGEGEAVQITFQNLSMGVLHLSILNLTPLRGIRRLYPKERDYQTILPHNARKILPKDMSSSISPPGRVRLAPKVKIPQRIKDSGGSYAEDLLKFIISTSPLSGLNSMQLPDLWEPGITGNVSSDSSSATWGSLSPEQNSQTRSGEPANKWICRDITIRSIAKQP